MPVGRPWKPGQSGNPGGRPKRIYELARLMREGLEHGKLVIDYVRDVAQGKVDVEPQLKFEVLKWATERGWGVVPLIDEEPEATLKPADLDAAEAALMNGDLQ